jgi:isochorismate hydrolase
METFGHLRPDTALLLVVDVQEKFAPVVSNFSEVVHNAAIVVRGCRELNVPIIVTEQYPKGLGKTVPEVVNALGDAYKPMVKSAFSIFDEADVHRAVDQSGRKDLILLGVEAHVCVIKSVLDGRRHGFFIHLVADAIGSRSPRNVEIALRRAAQAGAYVTSAEMALFQMLESSASVGFKEISKIVK